MPNRVSPSFIVFTGFSFAGAIFLGFLEIIGTLWLLGIPILLLVAFLIGMLVSRAPANVKVPALAVCILCVPVTTFIVHTLRLAEPETFVVPADFRGPFVIFLAEPCGAEAKYENGRRLYEVPRTGVLISQFNKNRGYLDQRFYLVDDNGARAEIPRFDWQKFETEEKYWNDSHARFAPLTKETVGVFYNYGPEFVFIAQNYSSSFLVSDYSLWDRSVRDTEIERTTLASSAERALKQCRESMTGSR